MYPFPLTAADFDVFDTNDCHELFLDQTLDEYNVGTGIDSSISGYPSSMGQNFEDVTDMSATILPEAWR